MEFQTCKNRETWFHKNGTQWNTKTVFLSKEQQFHILYSPSGNYSQFQVTYFMIYFCSQKSNYRLSKNRHIVMRNNVELPCWLLDNDKIVLLPRQSHWQEIQCLITADRLKFQTTNVSTFNDLNSGQQIKVNYL